MSACKEKLPKDRTYIDRFVRLSSSSSTGNKATSRHQQRQLKARVTRSDARQMLQAPQMLAVARAEQGVRETTAVIYHLFHNHY